MEPWIQDDLAQAAGATVVKLAIRSYDESSALVGFSDQLAAQADRPRSNDDRRRQQRRLQMTHHHPAAAGLHPAMEPGTPTTKRASPQEIRPR
jgi:hypothetical protein